MTTPPAPREIPPGWYPDPEGLPRSRYWDGVAWTEQTGPVLPENGSAPPIGPSGFVHYDYDPSGQPVSPSSRLVAALLCGFLGVFGVHRFYVGKVGSGVVQLLTAGGLGIWWLVDLVMIIVGVFRDKQGRLILNWQ